MQGQAGPVAECQVMGLWRLRQGFLELLEGGYGRGEGVVVKMLGGISHVSRSEVGQRWLKMLRVRVRGTC